MKVTVQDQARGEQAGASGAFSPRGHRKRSQLPQGGGARQCEVLPRGSSLDPQNSGFSLGAGQLGTLCLAGTRTPFPNPDPNAGRKAGSYVNHIVRTRR